MRSYVGRLAGVPVHKDEVPLTCTTESGEQADVLYWEMLGLVLVHPDRWERFLAELDKAGVKIEK